MAHTSTDSKYANLSRFSDTVERSCLRNQETDNLLKMLSIYRSKLILQSIEIIKASSQVSGRSFTKTKNNNGSSVDS